jgi:hypothetical protein
MQPETATMSGNLIWRPGTCGALCALVLFTLVVCASPAAEPTTVSAPRIESAQGGAPMSLPIAADRFGWLWTFLENTLHSRGRMIQFGVIGMCVALYFMFRARG